MLTDEKEREKELLEAEMIPTKPTVLSFWAKFSELQWKMLVSATSTQTDSHAYSSSPAEWPFMSRGIAYWIAHGNNAQIHFLGNIVFWLTGTVGVLVHIGLITFYFLRQQRRILDLSPGNSYAVLFQLIL